MRGIFEIESSCRDGGGWKMMDASERAVFGVCEKVEFYGGADQAEESDFVGFRAFPSISPFISSSEGAKIK